MDFMRFQVCCSEVRTRLSCIRQGNNRGSKAGQICRVNFISCSLCKMLLKASINHTEAKRVKNPVAAFSEKRQHDQRFEYVLSLPPAQYSRARMLRSVTESDDKPGYAGHTRRAAGAVIHISPAHPVPKAVDRLLQTVQSGACRYPVIF